MKKLITLVSTVSFFGTLGFALESFLLVLIIVELLSTKIFHFYDESMKLCQITTNPKTNISGYGAKPNSTLDTSTAQALKMAYMKTRLLVEILLKYHF